MKVDPESPAVQGLTTFLAFVVLNLLYLMTCLPVVTIGVATSALYEVTFRYADEERGNLLRDYIAALRRNAAQATAVFAALGLPLAARCRAAVDARHPARTSDLRGAARRDAGLRLPHRDHRLLRRLVRQRIPLPPCLPWLRRYGHRRLSGRVATENEAMIRRTP